WFWPNFVAYDVGPMACSRIGRNRILPPESHRAPPISSSIFLGGSSLTYLKSLRQFDQLPPDFEAPRVTPLTVADDSSPDRVRGDMSNTPLILLIDGNHQDREYYADLLRASPSHFVVLHATTGQAGLALCKRRPIDCVVLELDLSDMSGFQVLFMLNIPQIAVVILTRYSNPLLLNVAIEKGAQAALYKGDTSRDILHKAILNAMSVQKDQRRLVV